MDAHTRAIHLRVAVDRMAAIVRDPKNAHPPTPQHRNAKEKMREVAGAVRPIDQGVMTNKHADRIAGDYLMDIWSKCEHADNSIASLTGGSEVDKLRLFQTEKVRCYCISDVLASRHKKNKRAAAERVAHSKKQKTLDDPSSSSTAAAAAASTSSGKSISKAPHKALGYCHFTVEEFGSRLCAARPEVAPFFADDKRRHHLVNVIQEALDLPVKPIPRVWPKRNCIFGGTLLDDDDE